MYRGDRRREFKKGIDGDDSRRKREDQRLQLRKKDREAQLQKRRMLGNNGQSGIQLTEDPHVQEKLKDLPKLLAEVNCQDPDKQYEATVSFRKLLSIERNPPIQEVIGCGVIPRLVQLLKTESHPKLQFEAAWALTNIASGTSQHTEVVINNGAIPVFVKLLSSPNDEVREQAVWALGNIAGDSPKCRDMVLQCGALEPLCGLCNPNSKLTLLRNATWTLSNFCRGKPQPAFEHVQPALPVLAGLLHAQDDEVLTDACWAFSYLSDDSGPQNEKIQEVIKSGAVKQLVALMGHPSSSVKHPALRTIGNIVTGDDLQTQVVINHGALPRFLLLMSNQKKGIRKETCWAISNLTAGNVEQIEAVIQGNLMPPLIQLMREADFDTKKEASWAISNATSGGNEAQIRYLVHQGCIPPLCDLFACTNAKIQMVCLEGIENILRVGLNDAPNFNGVNKYAEFVEQCNGLDKLEQIQEQEQVEVEVYEKAVHIVKTYFDGAEEDEGGLAPNVAEGGAQFAFGVPANQQTAAQQAAANNLAQKPQFNF